MASFLPDFARNNHGNLAEQNRMVGAQHGVDTTRPAGAAPATVTAAPATKAGPDAAPTALLQKHACIACHGIDNKIVGPSYREVDRKSVV